ncbi:hypothetical protein [Mastigocladopsis repens]|uniref:hypothetical protein n=1 Tax=Mastigocladopsis repens TaxID=221287 RepID=UPI0002F5ED92|nr:hypothetical protein [Mastigocladopsis repens]
MQKTQLISSVLTSALLLSSLFSLGGNNAQAQKAQRPVSLLNAKCVNSGHGSVRQQNLDVSIGKAVYSSKFYLGPGNRFASITCNIKPENSSRPAFQTLNLGFGMRDNDTTSPGVEVKVYIDGQQTETRTIAPAQQASLTLDVSNASNVAIEAVCAGKNQYCDRVYFFNAALERQSGSSQTKK